MAYFGGGETTVMARTLRGGGESTYITRAYREAPTAVMPVQYAVHTGGGVVIGSTRPAWGQLWPRGAK